MERGRLREFYVTVSYLRGSGSQTFLVRAVDADAAVDAWRNGDGNLISDEHHPDGFTVPTVEENV